MRSLFLGFGLVLAACGGGDDGGGDIDAGGGGDIDAGNSDCGFPQSDACVVAAGRAESGSLGADASRWYTFTPTTAGAYRLIYTGTIQLSYHQGPNDFICQIDPGTPPADLSCCQSSCNVTMHDLDSGVGTPLVAGHTYYIQLYGAPSSGDFNFRIEAP